MNIKLTQGKYVRVDIEDYPTLSKFKWCYGKSYGGNGYAVRNIYPLDRKHPKKIYMHREIMGAKKSSEIVDHINWDTLDNRKRNLRITNRSVNARNVPKYAQILIQG